MPRRLLVVGLLASPAVAAAIAGSSRSAPQVGHVPSGVIADGAQYFAQSSHHGIAVGQLVRFRTRSLSGVEPNSNASRIERSR